MVAEVKYSGWTSVRAKIALLPLLGVLGILALTGVQYGADNKVQKALVLEREAALITRSVSDLLRLEADYLARIDPAILENVRKLSADLQQTTGSSLKDIADKAIRSRVEKSGQAIDAHLAVFGQASEAARILRETHAELSRRFRESEDMVRQAVEMITQEETERMMSGDALSDQKLAARETLKEFLAQYALGMAQVNDLLAFSDLDRYEATEAQVSEALQLAITNLNGMIGSTDDDKLKTVWAKIAAAVPVIQETRNRLVEDWRAKNTLTGDMDRTVEDISNAIDGVTRETAQQLLQLRRTTRLFVLGALVLTVFILVLISVLVARRIIRPVGHMTKAIERMADGDFRVRIEAESRDEIGLMAASLARMAGAQQGKTELAQAIAAGDLSREVILASADDELGHALESMNTRLNAVLSQAHEVVSQVAEAATQMTDSSQALSLGASQQASSLEEMTSAMTQIGTQTTTNAENADSADQLAQETPSDSRKRQRPHGADDSGHEGDRYLLQGNCPHHQGH